MRARTSKNVTADPKAKVYGNGGNYTISVRAGVRRGHLPTAMRAILFWSDDWARVSEWYTWSLPV